MTALEESQQEQIAGLREDVARLAEANSTLAGSINRVADIDEAQQEINRQMPALLAEFKTVVDEKRHLRDDILRASDHIQKVELEVARKASAADVESERERVDQRRKFLRRWVITPLVFMALALVVVTAVVLGRISHDAQTLKNDELDRALASYKNCQTNNDRLDASTKTTEPFLGLLNGIIAALPEPARTKVAKQEADLITLALSTPQQKKVDCGQYLTLAAQLRNDGAKSS